MLSSRLLWSRGPCLCDKHGKCRVSQGRAFCKSCKALFRVSKHQADGINDATDHQVFYVVQSQVEFCRNNNPLPPQGTSTSQLGNKDPGAPVGPALQGSAGGSQRLIMRRRLAISQCSLPCPYDARPAPTKSEGTTHVSKAKPMPGVLKHDWPAVQADRRRPIELLVRQRVHHLGSIRPNLLNANKQASASLTTQSGSGPCKLRFTSAILVTTTIVVHACKRRSI